MAQQEFFIPLLFTKLQELLNVTSLSIPFDGSGDSGCIDASEIKFYDQNNDEVELESALENDLLGFAESLGDHILERHYDYDWYNNDGGYGTINIDIANKTWSIEGYTRITDVEEANEDGSIDDIIKSYTEK
jgi:hypothetical protein